MAYKTFVAGEEALAADVNNYLMSQTIPRFPSAAARDAAITAPVRGQYCVLDTSPSELLFHNGTAWSTTGWYYTRFLSAPAINMTIPANGNNFFEFPTFNFGRIFSMSVMLLCTLGPAAGSTASTNITAQVVTNGAGVAPTASPVSSQQINTPNFPVTVTPVTAMWRNLAAGSQVTPRIRFTVGPTGGAILNVAEIHGIANLYSPGQEI